MATTIKGTKPQMTNTEGTKVSEVGRVAETSRMAKMKSSRVGVDD